MAAKLGGGNPKCPACNKTVYFAEKINALGKDWHKACLKCQNCGKKVEPGNFADKDGTLLCKPCHTQKSGIKGYGFGNSVDSHVRTGQAQNSVDTTGNPDWK